MNNSELYAFLQGGWHHTEIITDGDNRTIYQGKTCAAANSDDLPVWCVKRTTIRVIGGAQTIDEMFADGNMDFDNIWSNRANLTYKFLI